MTRSAQRKRTRAVLLALWLAPLACGNSSTEDVGVPVAPRDGSAGARETSAPGASEREAAALADSASSVDAAQLDSSVAVAPDPPTPADGAASVVSDAAALADARERVGEASDSASVTGPPCPDGMVRIASKNQSFAMGFDAAEGGTPWACFIGKHKVTFTYDFCMDSTLVTQRDYLKITGNNPSSHKGSDLLPVESLTWYDAIIYCNERSKREGLDAVYTYGAVTKSGNHVTMLADVASDIKKNGYRLPTNAEYEYAERSNLEGYLYFFSNTAPGTLNTAGGPADAYSWNVYNAGNTTHPVATKKPSPWGLYDIVGNVFEWENDWEGPYLPTDQTDPTGPADGNTPCGTDNTATPKRMGKGGGYAQDVKNHERISYHYKFYPWTVWSVLGFRAVRTAP